MPCEKDTGQHMVQSPTPTDIGFINSMATNIVRKKHGPAHGLTADPDGHRTHQFNYHQHRAKGMQIST